MSCSAASNREYCCITTVSPTGHRLGQFLGGDVVAGESPIFPILVGDWLIPTWGKMPAALKVVVKKTSFARRRRPSGRPVRRRPSPERGSPGPSGGVVERILQVLSRTDARIEVRGEGCP